MYIKSIAVIYTSSYLKLKLEADHADNTFKVFFNFLPRPTERQKFVIKLVKDALTEYTNIVTCKLDTATVLAHSE